MEKKVTERRMIQINFTFIFKSGKVSKVTAKMQEDEFRGIIEQIQTLEGKIQLITNKNSFIVNLGECAAVEYFIQNVDEFTQN